MNPTASFPMQLWEFFMLVVAIVYSIIVMYEYNRSGAHTPSTTPGPAVMNIGYGGRRLDLANPCETDLNDWSSYVQSWVNITALCAAVLVIDTIKQIFETACRRGFCNYFAQPDNLFNLATTVVQVFSALRIQIPNSIGHMSKRLSKIVKYLNVLPCIGAELDDTGELEIDDYNSWLDSAWEVFVVIVTLAEGVQAIVMPYTDCYAGPTLAVSSVGKPPVDFSDWSTENTVLVNISAILSVSFVLNVLLEYREVGCRGFWNDVSKVQMLAITAQVEAMQLGLPIPTALGRLIRPLLLSCGLGLKTKKAYEELVEASSEATMTKVAPLESDARQTQCCGKGSLLTQIQC